MSVSIFIRTYQKDLNWLTLCLQAIHDNLTGWSEIVIVIPTGQEHLLSHLTKERVEVCKSYGDDYLGQQVSKVKAHEYCNGDYVLFVDSDVMFLDKADVRDYFQDNKPVILKHNYNLVGEAICWKTPTEKLFKEEIEFEYMRRAPQLFHRSTLQKFNEHFSDIEKYIVAQPFRKFSEFNVLGFFAEKHEPSNYVFLDLEYNAVPPNKAKQYWSWSGLTPQEKQEIELKLGK